MHYRPQEENQCIASTLDLLPIDQRILLGGSVLKLSEIQSGISKPTGEVFSWAWRTLDGSSGKEPCCEMTVYAVVLTLRFP